ncbi:RYamide receptor-like [Actinia tenebrosa]|uniref:RYamide receptor-like n=1 Tax=Actinia tenebrosa TaxID=6105 RepID=A0A6P8IIQ2_ACTTE|nr:RYamide receptor-like [Actinia tenebrosa]
MMNNTTERNLTLETCLEGKEEEEEDKVIMIIKVMAYVTVLLVSLVGNSLIIAVYYKRRTYPSAHGMLNDALIVNLSCSDLLMVIFAIPERITRLIQHQRWMMPGRFGVLMCKLVNFNEAVSIVVSLLTLDVIAVERFMAVFYPIKRSVSSRKMKSIIIATWLIAVSYNSPLLYYSQLIHEGTKTLCNARTSMWDTKTWLFFYFALVSITLVTVVVCYLAIFVKVSKIKQKKLSANRRQRMIITRRVQRTSLAIILAFYLYLCYWLKRLLCAFNHLFHVCKNPVLGFMSVYLAITNSALNPIICFSFSANFRQGIKRLIKL